ncbi:MAG: sigma-54-dependent Fis family transcriptional regulator [Planctomycetota bacterium]|nr:MAG: sigma-54-dependent Fis family transcriptional regulator [Planctomycetota bacterium]
MRAILRVRRKSGKGERRIELTEGVLRVGRAEDNDLVISGAEVSRYHLRIEYAGGVWEAVDLGSRNGTYVNERRIHRKVLMRGDKICVGGWELLFETEGSVGDDTCYDVMSVGEGVLAKEGSRQDADADAWERLVQINRALTEELDPKRLLKTIMQKVLEVVSAERAFLLLREGGELRTYLSRTFDGETVRRADLKVSHSIAKTVMETNEPVLSVNAQEDSRFRDAMSVHGLGLKSILCVPLRLEGRPIGVLYVDNRFEKGAFGERELRFLELFADQAALAVRNARLFEESRKKQQQLQEALAKIEELNRRLQKALARREADLREARHTLATHAHSLKHDFSAIITRSPKMLEALYVVDKVIESDVPVLIEGESGTGKELVARAIHNNSPRRRGRFVAVNCSAIPPQLLESEFFGYVRGAFTGAEKEKEGLFERANGGTLFLDEVGDMPLQLQAKLLRVLEEKRVRRLGSTDERYVDVRVISATNKDLLRLVAEGHFREDLFYRLNVVSVRLPPLRERQEDIPLLVERILEEIAARTAREKKRISRDALDVLLRYDWPGNVRELRNEMERAAALADECIEVEHLSERIVAAVMEKVQDKDVAALRARLEAKKGVGLARIRQEIVGAVEKAAIEAVLQEVGWKKSAAARRLGISRPTLDAKIARYGIRPPQR